MDYEGTSTRTSSVNIKKADIHTLMISTLDLARVLRRAEVSSLSEEVWPRLATHECWALSQRKLGLVTGTLTLQLVRMVEDRKGHLSLL